MSTTFVVSIVVILVERDRNSIKLAKLLGSNHRGCAQAPAGFQAESLRREATTPPFRKLAMYHKFLLDTGVWGFYSIFIGFIELLGLKE